MEASEGGDGGEATFSWTRGGGGAGAGLYFMGDSLERKSRREGSRSRRGLAEEDEGGGDFPQNQSMAGAIGSGVQFIGY